ncbi:MAG: LuxR C-terminal-related transcriptional regulator [Flavobacteriales bacterium]
MAHLIQFHENPPLYNSASNPLTHREREFLVRVCNPAEHTYKQIAEHMQVHRRTVDGYRVAIFNKFGIRSKVGLVLLAVRCGLVKV